jgi:hypothetical protein
VVKHAREFVRGRPGSKLLSVKEYSNVERSTKFHKIHLHSYFTCVTTGISFIDLNRLRKFINTNLRQVPGFVRSNLWVQPIKSYNDDKAVTYYINKDPIEDDSESDNEFEVMPLS